MKYFVSYLSPHKSNNIFLESKVLYIHARTTTLLGIFVITWYMHNIVLGCTLLCRKVVRDLYGYLLCIVFHLVVEVLGVIYTLIMFLNLYFCASEYSLIYFCKIGIVHRWNSKKWQCCMYRIILYFILCIMYFIVNRL